LSESVRAEFIVT